MLDPTSPPDLRHQDTARLEEMAEAGRVVLDSYRLLEKSNTNIVAEVLRDADPFFQWDHYPEGDVYDWERHAQYYYHAHPPEKRPPGWIDEHGHFHTFLRPKGMPEGIAPAELPGATQAKGDNEALCHLIAIAMDRNGYPARLFTVNRWVTGETWYTAPDVIRMLDYFEIDQALPSLPVNRWITNFPRLYRPLVEDLVRERDKTIASHIDRSGREAGAVYNDASLEVTSFAEVTFDAHIGALNTALSEHGSAARVEMKS